jgi:serine/threonine protein kinase
MTHIEPKMRFGDYEAVHFIASGGMGETWGGVKVSLTKGVAIKVLSPDRAQDPDAQNRFFREARITAALEHGRIVPVIDYGAHNGFLYLVMPRIDGVDLRTFLKAYRTSSRVENFPPLLAAHIAGDVVEALRYAHGRTVGGREHGVMHRDITPGNVLVSSNGETFVTDFGIARYVTDRTEGPIMGSLRYMAPEQADGMATIQSDIFGVGAITYYLLTGSPPLNINTNTDIRNAYRNPVPRIERDDIPEPLQEFLARCLAFDLDDRYPDADTALAALDKIRPDEGPRNTTVLRTIYRKCVSEPKSHVTGYLQREDAGASFLLSLYWRRAEARGQGRDELEDEKDEKDEDARGNGRATLTMPVSPPFPKAEAPMGHASTSNARSDDDDDDDDDSGDMPWLRWREESDSPEPEKPGDEAPAPEGRGSTMVLPARDADGVPVVRRRVATVAVPSNVGRPEARSTEPVMTERVPFTPTRTPERARTAPMAAASSASFGSVPAGVASPTMSSTPQPLPVYHAAHDSIGSASMPMLAPTPRPAASDPGRRSSWVPMGVMIVLLSLMNLGFILYNSRDATPAEPSAAASLSPVETSTNRPAEPEPVTVLVDHESSRSAAAERPEAPASVGESAYAATTPARVLESSLTTATPPDNGGDERRAADPSGPDDAPTQPTGEPAPASEDEGPATTASEETAPKAIPPQSKPRVRVLFFLKGASYGEIKLAGRTMTVEHAAVMNLRPGYYSAQWRRRGETQWHASKKIRIPALDPKSQFFEVRLDVDGHSGYTRATPGKRGGQ